MAKPSFRPRIVQKKLNGLFPRLTAFEAIPGGDESQVFRFDSEGQAFILRLNPSVHNFKKDAFVHNRFARPELPIPEVIGLGDFEDCFYCISRRLPGRTLQDLEPEELSALLVPTCGVWHAIAKSHLKEMSGFGPFDHKGAATCQTWRAFLTGVLDPAKHDWKGLRVRTKVDGLEG